MSQLGRNLKSGCASLILMLVASFVLSAKAAPGYYRATVIDYAPIWNNSSPPQNNLMDNVNMFATLINGVAQPDIVVFPEGCLQAMNTSVLLTIPSPAQNITPFGNSSYNPALQSLSQMAQTFNTYLVVNVYENHTVASKTYKYSTNVVFNRKGAIISRYRKYNSASNLGLDVPTKLENSSFTTDFNVTFGQLISEDILYKEPAFSLMKANINDFIYTTRWSSQLPFLTSVQAQWMWSYGKKVNLIASGYNDIPNGRVGSGIYRGLSGSTQLSVFDDLSGNSVITNDVPIPGCVGTGCESGNGASTTQTAVFTTPIQLGQQSITNFAHQAIDLPLNGTNSAGFATVNKQLCHNSLCCTFNVSISYDASNTSIPTMYYRLAVFNGKTPIASSASAKGLQICGIVSCSNASVESCGSLDLNGTAINKATFRQATFNQVSIGGNFVQQDADIMPNILLWPGNSNQFLMFYSQVNFTLNGNDGLTHLITSPSKQILTAAIYSRVYSRDGTSSGGYKSTVTTLSTLFPALLITKFIFFKLF